MLSARILFSRSNPSVPLPSPPPPPPPFPPVFVSSQGITDPASFGVKVVPFGSYALGAHFPGSDIDTVLVALSHVSREDFFGDFQARLRLVPSVADLVAVADARVPLMKMHVRGIPIDLQFARLAGIHAIAPDFDILSVESYLSAVDEVTALSLSGPRVAAKVLATVPDIHNYRTALRCVKLWANRACSSGSLRCGRLLCLAFGVAGIAVVVVVMLLSLPCAVTAVAVEFSV